jgi:hypothetical protein
MHLKNENALRGKKNNFLKNNLNIQRESFSAYIVDYLYNKDK